jgi:hypothetical protein
MRAKTQQVTLALWVVAALALTVVPPTQRDARAEGLDTPRLELGSHFWPNLHQFLYLVAQAELGAAPTDRPTVRAAREDGLRKAELTDAERAGWERALAHYRSNLARLAPWDELADLNARLAGTEEHATPQLPSPDNARALEGAAPAYRRIWWPSHHRANVRWIDEQSKRQKEFGRAVAQRLSRELHAKWPDMVIPVEIVAHCTIYGAFQQDAPAMLHLSSTYVGHQGTGGFEQLYHEAAHLVDDVVLMSLTAEARRQGMPENLGRWADLTHAIVFYASGNAVRRSLPDHVPYAEAQGVWRRAPANRTRLGTNWQPYLDGEIGFEDAIRRLVASFGSPNAIGAITR